MINRYLSLAQQGKNVWWRYVVSIVIILFFYQIIGCIPLAVMYAFLAGDGNPATNFNLLTLQAEGVDSLFSYLIINAIPLALLAGLYLTVRFIHKRRLITLITPNAKLNWRRVLQGGGIYFGITLIITAIGMAIAPQDYQLTFKPIQFLIFLPIALIITPLQTSAEELFFRGYIMQGIGLKTQNSFIPVFGSSILFMLPHLANPEVKSNFWLMASYYLGFGLFLAFITIRDNSLELAMGVHAANNLFVALILNFPGSSLPSPSIFTGPKVNPLADLIWFILAAVIFCFAIFRKPAPSRAD